MTDHVDRLHKLQTERNIGEPHIQQRHTLNTYKNKTQKKHIKFNTKKIPQITQLENRSKS